MIRLALLALIVAACGARATPVPTPEPVVTPFVSQAPVYDDATKTRLVLENIAELYADADWYPFLHQVDGHPDVLVDGTSLFIGTLAPDNADGRAVAKAICVAIATAAYDANANPIGYKHVHLINAQDVELADCDTRD